MKMTVVTQVVTQLYESELASIVIPDLVGNSPVHHGYHKEEIRGRRFINERGEEVCIGFSKQAEEAIGMPFEVIENQESEIEHLRGLVHDSEFLSMCLARQRDDALSDRAQVKNRIARLSFKDRVKVFFTILFGTQVLQDIVGIK